MQKFEAHVGVLNHSLFHPHFCLSSFLFSFVSLFFLLVLYSYFFLLSFRSVCILLTSLLIPRYPLLFFSSLSRHSYLCLFCTLSFPLSSSQSYSSVCCWWCCKCVVYMQCSVFRSLTESQCSIYLSHNALLGDGLDYAKCARVCVYVMFLNKA